MLVLGCEVGGFGVSGVWGLYRFSGVWGLHLSFSYRVWGPESRV